MPAPHATPAPPAAPDPNPEPPHMRADRHHDVLLVLVRHTLQLELAATARTVVRQRHLDLLIDVIRDPTVRLGAIPVATLTPRAPRIRLRVALRERRRLTLPR